MTGTDIIGDIHGHAHELEQFLSKLGYDPYGAHPEGRKIIFTGDLINRGPSNARVMEIVKGLMDRGIAQAVLGNHEMNAITYGTKGKNGFVRNHTEENTNGLGDFLKEFPFNSARFTKALHFFRALPVFIENEAFRVIHACWHDPSIKALREDNKLGRKGNLTQNAWRSLEHKKTIGAIDTLVRGPDYKLPKDVYIYDSKGNSRSKARLLWWEKADQPANLLLEKGHTLTGLSVQDSKNIYALRQEFECKARKRPIFVGHYNIPSEPFLTSSHVACVNFRGFIVAYRWNNGDTALHQERLVWDFLKPHV